MRLRLGHGSLQLRGGDPRRVTLTWTTGQRGLRRLAGPSGGWNWVARWRVSADIGKHSSAAALRQGARALRLHAALLLLERNCRRTTCTYSTHVAQHANRTASTCKGTLLACKSGKCNSGAGEAIPCVATGTRSSSAPPRIGYLRLRIVLTCPSPLVLMALAHSN